MAGKIFRLQLKPTIYFGKFKERKGFPLGRLGNAEQVFIRFRGFFKDMRPFLKRTVGKAIRKSILASFKNMSGPKGAAWAGLDADYIKKKKKLGGHQKMGLLTGDLRNALTKQSHPANIYKIDKHRIIWGVNTNMIPYAEAFTKGAVRSVKQVRSNPASKRFGIQMGRGRPAKKRIAKTLRRSGQQFKGFQPARPIDFLNNEAFRNLLTETSLEIYRRWGKDVKAVLGRSVGTE